MFTAEMIDDATNRRVIGSGYQFVSSESYDSNSGGSFPGVIVPIPLHTQNISGKIM
jgi:hypothetical protein